MSETYQYSPDGPLSTELHRWHVLALAAILLVGAALRTAYLLELRRSPEFTYHAVDAAFHDYWARGLATGDWTVPDGYTDPQIRSTAYLRPPGYPFFLAAVYYVFGTGPWAPRIVQMALGLVNCVLVYLLGRKWIGPRVGLVAAALMAVYWAFIYFEPILLAPVLLVMLGLALLYVLSLWTDGVSFWRGLAAGVLLGAFALVRPNILLFLPVVGVWSLWVAARRRLYRGFGVAVVGLVVGTIACIAPVTTRNHRIADDWVLISSNAGVNLYIGNNERATGYFTPDVPGLEMFGTCFDYPELARSVGERVGHPVKGSEISAYFTRQALRYAWDHPGPALALLGRKTLLFWGPKEVANNGVPDVAREHSAVLARVPVGFAAAGAGAALGLAIFLVSYVGRGRASVPRPSSAGRSLEIGVLLILFVLTYFVSFLPFFVAGRFRVPVAAALLLWAAYGTCRLIGWLRQRRWMPAVGWASVGVGFYALFATNWSGYRPSAATWHYHMGVAHEFSKDFDEASEHYGRALQIEPRYAPAHYNLGVLLARRGQRTEAIAHYRSALHVRPNHVGARNNLALALAAEGSIDEAIKHCLLAIQSRPNDADLHNNLAALLNKAGRMQEAIEQYQTAVRLNPDDAEIRRNLAAALESVGSDEQALHHYAEAIRIDPQDADLHTRLGLALARRGRLAEAIDHYQRAVEAQPDHALAHYNLGNALAQQGRDRDALEHFRKAVQLRPEHHVMLDSLAWLLATSRDDRVRNGLEAVRLAERACQLVGQDNPKLLDTLAAAYAAAGRFDNAVTTANRAVQAALSRGDAHYAAEIRSRLERYRSAQPLY